MGWDGDALWTRYVHYIARLYHVWYGLKNASYTANVIAHLNPQIRQKKTMLCAASCCIFLFCASLIEMRTC